MIHKLTELFGRRKVQDLPPKDAQELSETWAKANVLKDRHRRIRSSLALLEVDKRLFNLKNGGPS